ncbi:MAG: hypothetical protein K8T26_12145 [Lentisphaerae bacterium]|nr:hypothetical protein [Lentisphaerota bacterium]
MSIAVAALAVWAPVAAHGQFRMAGMNPTNGWLALGLGGAFTNGICIMEAAPAAGGPWTPAGNVFTTNPAAALNLQDASHTAFYRARALDLSMGRAGFTNLTHAYGLLTTVAGAGGTRADDNEWLPAFEGGAATNARLSTPHMAMANRAGDLFIVDKEAHAVREVRLDGTIITVVGTNRPGNGPDTPTPGTQVGLNDPNGLWVSGNGMVYVLDLDNGKVRRLGTNGLVSTLFSVPGGIAAGRGLWVDEGETRAYVASRTVVKRWTPAGGVVDYATGFSDLANLTVDPWGNLVVSDRGTHSIWRVTSNGTARVRIAGNGLATGGGDGQLATETGLNGARGVCFLPTGAFFLCTHAGNQVWYVDTAGYVHLVLNGGADTHAGDGTWFYDITEQRISETRAVSLDFNGNLLITENDRGYVRKVQFLSLGVN